jgi:uncharacterized membrane protein YsdA (DUF1294 family)
MFKKFIQLLSIIIIFNSALVAMDKGSAEDEARRLSSVLPKPVEEDKELSDGGQLEGVLINDEETSSEDTALVSRMAPAVRSRIERENRKWGIMVGIMVPSATFFVGLGLCVGAYAYYEWDRETCQTHPNWQKCGPAMALSSMVGGFIGGMVSYFSSDALTDIIVNYQTSED